MDVHQATVVACLLTGPSDQKPNKQVRGFGTTTAQLQTRCALAKSGGFRTQGGYGAADAFVDADCRHVAKLALRAPD